MDRGAGRKTSEWERSGETRGNLTNTEYSRSGVGVSDRERSDGRMSEKLVERQFSSPPLIYSDRQSDMGFLI
jgi:hypothetical protein